MTISSQTRKAGPFTGNGTTVNFPFSFKCFTSADLRVVLTDAAGNETDLTLTSQYTVALNPDQNASAGGTVTTLTAYSSSYKVTIVGDVDYTQETDITNGGGFYPEVIESAFDKITMQIQQVNEKADRAVKVDVSSGVSPTDYLTTVEGYKTDALAAAAAALISENNADISEANALTSANNAEAYAASINPTLFVQKSNNLSDVANAATARTNLGVTGTGADTTYNYRANNLSDVANAATARTNLGLEIGTNVQAYNAATALTSALQTFTASQRGAITVDNDLSFDLSIGNNFTCTPTATGTLTFTNHTAGQSGYILLDNSGGYAVTAAATTKVNSSFLSTVSTAGTYLLSYFDDGTNAYVTTGGAMS